MDDLELTQALRSLATQHSPMPRSEEIEAHLLAAFDDKRRRGSRSLWLPAIGLAAAASLAAIGLVHDVRGRTTAQPTNEIVFVAIPYTIPPAPYERTTVVRMDVEIAALMAAGFKIQTADAGASVPAEVLFAQDGHAVAIRPLNVPIL